MSNSTKCFGSKVITVLLVIASSLLLSACTKEVSKDNLQTGILKNLTGLDGCGWVIQLPDNTKLEPINLTSFTIGLKENLKVDLKYHERKDIGSYCMVGKVVEIEYLTESKE